MADITPRSGLIDNDLRPAIVSVAVLVDPRTGDFVPALLRATLQQSLERRARALPGARRASPRSAIWLDRRRLDRIPVDATADPSRHFVRGIGPRKIHFVNDRPERLLEGWFPIAAEWQSKQADDISGARVRNRDEHPVALDASEH